MSRLKHLVSERVPLWARFGGRKLLYMGGKLTCPMCGSSVRTYLQNGEDIPVLTRRKVVGGAPRPDDRCPVCHAQDRTRLMRLYLDREVGVGRKPLSILHIAPDLGLLLWLQRQPDIDYTATDLSPRRYRHVPNFVRGDITALPFEESRFDIVICSHVLEHVPDDAAAMAELYRVMKPGGVALTPTPLATDDAGTDEDLSVTDPQERSRRFGQWDHVRLYHRDDFVARLERAGFAVSLWDAFATAPDWAAAAHLNPLEMLPVCRRP